MRLNHISDTILKDSAPEVVIIKPGYYFETWAAEALKTTQENPPRFVSAISPADHKMPMVKSILMLFM